MKKCPYCAEEIQDEAIYCRWCNHDLPVAAKDTYKKVVDFKETNVDDEYIIKADDKSIEKGLFKHFQATVKKPDILPPELSDNSIDNQVQQVGTLNDLMKKYMKDLRYLQSSNVWLMSKIRTYRTAIKDLFKINFSSISFFLESQLNKRERRELDRNIKTYSTVATLGSWVIGIDYFVNSEEDAKSILTISDFNINDLPPKVLNLLILAANTPYMLLGGYFNGYYESPYGRKMQFQQEEHLIDIYQSILVAVRECFLEGIRYKHSHENS